MDGATIPDKNGYILAIGAIVPVAGDVGEGGRAAAARTLAKYGAAFKVSQDGPVTMYAPTAFLPAKNSLGEAENEAQAEEVLRFG